MNRFGRKLVASAVALAGLATLFVSPADAEEKAPPVCYPGVFVDVLAGHPFFTEIYWLVGEGVTAGYADCGYHPSDPISRQAMAAFLYRFAGSPDGPSPFCAVRPFPDVLVSNQFCGHIRWVANEGIAAGYADGGYHPISPISRQAMAAFLFNYDAAALPRSSGPSGRAAGPDNDDAPAVLSGGAEAAAAAASSAAAGAGAPDSTEGGAQSLPSTGANSLDLAQIGLALMLGGGLIVLGTRRRTALS